MSRGTIWGMKPHMEFSMQPALATRRPLPTDAVAAAQQHLVAAQSLGRQVAAQMNADAKALRETAVQVEALGAIVPAGVREEARKLAEYLAGMTQRLDRLVGAA